jgi:hypothetical protein
MVKGRTSSLSDQMINIINVLFFKFLSYSSSKLYTIRIHIYW